MIGVKGSWEGSPNTETFRRPHATLIIIAMLVGEVHSCDENSRLSCDRNHNEQDTQRLQYAKRWSRFSTCREVSGS